MQVVYIFFWKIVTKVSMTYELISFYMNVISGGCQKSIFQWHDSEAYFGY